ncbi:MAG: 30S ribosomal protein S17 [Candidatus Uhrbacteria bacterium GW2011_GWE2_45_35]|uniref:Small ribosomal subunit protein uS17 n=2 Tax=Candidatus Uhriibacteriota TaxID=1752732 RepID=A0A0G1JKU9_9BACT|nr:MAG: 30S ribosomal protein S17 [Candidatus Uhrbacteria bacterium GW2011_GWF2_44_350]KKU09236.1 MAG: 30S ribosomal protein S17 [Candidatus Uhrbacteria bacterium GW2011_GWE2_45_35]HBR80481.1 30S ribosomal protein S17 [Candidatus Uhrbacteria bacterium]HCU31534.1 30S ribosomal protein S17 [Candidatus Uhrbacteria bacterium]
MSNQTSKTQRNLRGLVVSDKMTKTIVVRVDRTVLHQKYQKRYISSRRYKVHDEKMEAKVGDSVEFVECRPLSRDKRWRLVKVLKKAA